MGRGSDTRLYAPRGESETMYTSVNEDETKYGPTSSHDKEKRMDEKKEKEESRKKKLKDIKHIKIKPSQGLSAGSQLETEPGLDDGNKRDDEREMGLQGGPAGSRGALLDLATGAKSGTGSAIGSIMASEPMADAWSELLKEDDGPHSFDLNEMLNSPKHSWYQAVMGTDTPLIDNLVNSGMMSALGIENHHDGDAEIITSMHNDDLHSQSSIDMLMAHRNSLLVLDNIMSGKGHTVPQEFMDMHNNSDLTQMLGDAPPQAHIALNLVGMYNNLNYLGQKIGPQMNEPDEDWQNKLASKPMDNAWSELLKEEPLVHPGENQYKHQYKMPSHEDVHPEWYSWIQELVDDPAEYEGIADDFTQPDMNHLAGAKSREDFFERLNNLHNFIMNDAQPEFTNIEGYRDFTDVPYNEETGFTMSEPMDNAWSTLLKRETPSTMAARRRREKRQEFRPSTGQFKKPPGGMSGGSGATMRRFKAQMRGIKSGKKTGLMKPHLSVEMSHRGIATKQPMSKDPQRYGQYMGQSEARKRLGNVRTVFSPHARHSARSFSAGPTGAGRLSGLMPGQQGLMAKPSLQRMRTPRPPRIPSVRRPPTPMAPQMAPPMSSVPSMPAPSSSMMMSDERTKSEILKSNRHAARTEYLKLMRELMRLQREKLNKAGTASAFEEGAVPPHPAGVHQHEDEDEKNDGPTQNLETNSSRLGLDPAGYLVSRRGHMG